MAELSESGLCAHFLEVHAAVETWALVSKRHEILFSNLNLGLLLASLSLE